MECAIKIKSEKCAIFLNFLITYDFNEKQVMKEKIFFLTFVHSSVISVSLSMSS